MSRTAEIIASMRAADAAHAARNAEKLADGTMRGLPRIRPALATSAGRADAAGTATLLLRATPSEAVADYTVATRNNVKRDHALPRIARSMATKKGKQTPDQLASVMAFFQNPSDMAQSLLGAFLPTKLGTADVKALFAEEYVTDMVGAFLATHGKGSIPTAANIIRAVGNPATGRSGRAPSRLLIADGVTPPTVDPKRRGRPSGPKYVAYLPPTADVCEAAALLLTGPRPMYGPENLLGIPGGNDVAQGLGHERGAGWEARIVTDEKGRWVRTLSMTPDQRVRLNAALAGVTYVPASDLEG